ncbi:MAG: hypothetical protein N2260_01100 [Syntrophobacterales bacterium]|nr:hypothetical protein [Syntrophobacterales bacterium]
MERSRSYVLSFNPMVKADLYRLCAGREPKERDAQIIKRARAVILPQGCSPDLYWMAVRYCPRVFPNYRCRFLYPGKTGQVRMFRAFGLPHPRTSLFGSTRDFPRFMVDSLKYPVVVKGNTGGEGENVLLVSDRYAMEEALYRMFLLEKSGCKGFLIQDYVPNDGKDLRIVIMGNRFYAYWRVSPQGEFLHNISKGARYELESDEDRKKAGLRLASTLKRLTGINLAGIDIIFHEKDREGEKPMLLEVNYFFGRTGLGGNEAYYRLLNEVVEEWLNSTL